MRYLLDTNVVSEQVSPRPDPGVREWVEALDPGDSGVSAVTVGEIQRGVLKLGPGARRSILTRWLEEIPVHFENRVLPVDIAVARAWGRLMQEGRGSGRELNVLDGLILATAAVHGLVVVTRDERDFRDRGVFVLNPWKL